MPLQGHRPILLRQTPVKILHHILTRSHPLTQKMPGQDKDAVCLIQISTVLSVLPVPADMDFHWYLTWWSVKTLAALPVYREQPYVYFFPSFSTLISFICTILQSLTTLPHSSSNVKNWRGKKKAKKMKFQHFFLLQFYTIVIKYPSICSFV